MRTTLTLEESIARELKRRARDEGKSFKSVVNETLLRGLSPPGRQPKRYKLRTVSLGGPLPGIDLDKALTLAGELEDAERARKLSRGR
jgi:hypothetical protein